MPLGIVLEHNSKQRKEKLRMGASIGTLVVWTPSKQAEVHTGSQQLDHFRSFRQKKNVLGGIGGERPKVTGKDAANVSSASVIK